MNETIPRSVQVTLCGEEAELLPERTVLMTSRRTIIVSDIHIGKSSHFRREGVAVPSSMKHADLHRLSELLNNYNPSTLIILGDLFHVGHLRDSELFLEWRRIHSGTDIVLVRGNHDRISQSTAGRLGLEFCNDLKLGGMTLTHFEHPGNDDSFVVHGHVHPAVRVYGKGRQSAVLHCFRLRSNSLVLPAFGEFTGRHVLTPINGDRFFAVVGSGEDALVKELR